METRYALKEASPVIFSYLILGSAFGLYAHNAGIHIIWILATSLFIYAGSMQFASVKLLTTIFNPLQAILLTLSINIRYILYGFSLLKKYDGVKHKWYMIFALSDESFSLVIKDIPDNLNKGKTMLIMLFLNHITWILGTFIGVVIGSALPFNTNGIEFTMTALFATILLDKLNTTTIVPVVVGTLVSIICIILFGKEQFVIYAIVLIVISLFAIEKRKNHE